MEIEVKMMGVNNSLQLGEVANGLLLLDKLDESVNVEIKAQA